MRPSLTHSCFCCHSFSCSLASLPSCLCFPPSLPLSLFSSLFSFLFFPRFTPHPILATTSRHSIHFSKSKTLRIRPLNINVVASRQMDVPVNFVSTATGFRPDLQSISRVFS